MTTTGRVDLNPEQRAAVEAADGPVLVLAGPGSGKTRVLTHRAAHLVGRGVRPWNVMAVTFTNKAAREMASRLEALVGAAALADMTLGTFHAICARMLRRDGVAIGIDPHFTIFDTDDQLAAVRRALTDLNVDDKSYRPAAVLGAISNAKNELLRPGDYRPATYWHEVAGRVYRRYQEILRSAGGLDFDDLLLEVAFMLRDDPDVRSRYQERYRHVLVDEFQDTNTAQYALLKSLVAADAPSAPHNLFVVGDEDQSIYRWRGADWRNIERFRRDFPESRTVLLERNYRSTQTILDAARAVIDVNRHRTAKNLWTDGGAGARVTLFQAYDEAEEAAYVVRCIEAEASRGASYGDFAVMYRTNAQSRALEDAFVRRSMPYQLVGATRFYERREVRDVLAYLRLVQNPRDDLSLDRVINVPGRGIGRRTLEVLADRALVAGSAWDALSEMAGDAGSAGTAGATGRGAAALIGFHRLLADLLDLRERLELPELVDAVLERTGYAAWLRDGTEEGEDRWENVLELRGVASGYAGLPPREALAAMLEAVALVSDVDDLAESSERVTLMTLHSAKGLEFDTVFLTGLEEKTLPHSRSVDDPEEMAEERRLFYVGITRARRKLHLVHAHRRTLFGSSEVREPSRFLGDIPPDLLADAVGSPVRSGRASRPAATVTWRTGSAPPASAEATFRPGDRVRHPSFGSGVVVSSLARGDDEEVTVAFAGQGVKKLMQRFARLERA